MHRPFYLKFLSLVVSSALVWTSGGALQAAQAIPDVFAAPSTLPQFQLIPPGRYGRIVDYFNADDPKGDRRREKAETKPLVILIQDLHAHYGVQKNIAGLLEFLSAKLSFPPSPLAPPPFALAVEGASGPVDSSLLALYPEEKVKLAAADYLMKEGELTGAEYFAIKRGLPNFLIGAENEQYYTVHRELFRKTLADRNEMVKELKTIQADMKDLPRHVFRKNKPLWEFEQKVQAYDNAQISTHEFIGILMDYVGAGFHPRPPSDSNFGQARSPAPTINVQHDFPALAFFAANSHFGTMEQIRAETAQFLTQIQNQLSPEERKNLQVLAKNNGTSTYYLYLRDLVYQKQLFLAVPPELAHYLEYIHTAQTMGMDQVTHQAKELAFKIGLALAQESGSATPAADLVQVQHDLDLLLRLADLQATEFEVRDFAPRLNQFVALTKTLLARPTGDGGREKGEEGFDESRIRQLISSSIDFYVMALIRNKPMIENTLKLIPSPLASHSSVAVLVAGGFHTASLTQMLREKNISYLVLSPTVDKITDADSDLYVKRLSGQLLTEEDILAAAEDKQSTLYQVARADGLVRSSSSLADLWPFGQNHSQTSLAIGSVATSRIIITAMVVMTMFFHGLSYGQSLSIVKEKSHQTLLIYASGASESLVDDAAVYLAQQIGVKRKNVFYDDQDTHKNPDGTFTIAFTAGDNKPNDPNASQKCFVTKIKGKFDLRIEFRHSTTPPAAPAAGAPAPSVDQGSIWWPSLRNMIRIGIFSLGMIIAAMSQPFRRNKHKKNRNDSPPVLDEQQLQASMRATANALRPSVEALQRIGLDATRILELTVALDRLTEDVRNQAADLRQQGTKETNLLAESIEQNFLTPISVITPLAENVLEKTSDASVLNEAQDSMKLIASRLDALKNRPPQLVNRDSRWLLNLDQKNNNQDLASPPSQDPPALTLTNTYKAGRILQRIGWRAFWSWTFSDAAEREDLERSEAFAQKLYSPDTPEEKERLAAEDQWTRRRVSWWYEYFASYRSDYVNRHPDPYSQWNIDHPPHEGMTKQQMESLNANAYQIRTRGWFRMHMASVAGAGIVSLGIILLPLIHSYLAFNHPVDAVITLMLSFIVPNMWAHYYHIVKNPNAALTLSSAVDPELARALQILIDSDVTREQIVHWADAYIGSYYGHIYALTDADKKIQRLLEGTVITFELVLSLKRAVLSDDIDTQAAGSLTRRSFLAALLAFITAGIVVRLNAQTQAQSTTAGSIAATALDKVNDILSEYSTDQQAIEALVPDIEVPTSSLGEIYRNSGLPPRTHYVVTRTLLYRAIGDGVKGDHEAWLIIQPDQSIPDVLREKARDVHSGGNRKYTIAYLESAIAILIGIIGRHFWLSRRSTPHAPSDNKPAPAAPVHQVFPGMIFSNEDPGTGGYIHKTIQFNEADQKWIVLTKTGSGAHDWRKTTIAYTEQFILDHLVVQEHAMKVPTSIHDLRDRLLPILNHMEALDLASPNQAHDLLHDIQNFIAELLNANRIFRSSPPGETRVLSKTLEDYLFNPASVLELYVERLEISRKSLPPDEIYLARQALQDLQRRLDILASKDVLPVDDLGRFDLLSQFPQRNPPSYEFVSSRSNGRELLRAFQRNPGFAISRQELQERKRGEINVHNAAYDILASPQAEQLLLKIPAGSRPLGKGNSAIALIAPSGEVIRIGPALERPQIPEMLQATRTERIGNWQIEWLPFADPEAVTDHDIKQIEIALRARGYTLSDYKRQNIGIFNGRPYVIDPGALIRLPQNSNASADVDLKLPRDGGSLSSMALAGRNGKNRLQRISPVSGLQLTSLRMRLQIDGYDRDILEGIDKAEIQKLDASAQRQGVTFTLVNDNDGAFIRREGNEILINQSSRLNLSPEVRLTALIHDIEGHDWAFVGKVLGRAPEDIDMAIHEAYAMAIAEFRSVSDRHQRIEAVLGAFQALEIIEDSSVDHLQSVTDRLHLPLSDIRKNRIREALNALLDAQERGGTGEPSDFEQTRALLKLIAEETDLESLNEWKISLQAKNREIPEWLVEIENEMRKDHDWAMNKQSELDADHLTDIHAKAQDTIERIRETWPQIEEQALQEFRRLTIWSFIREFNEEGKIAFVDDLESSDIKALQAHLDPYFGSSMRNQKLVSELVKDFLVLWTTKSQIQKIVGVPAEETDSLYFLKVLGATYNVNEEHYDEAMKILKDTVQSQDLTPDEAHDYANLLEQADRLNSGSDAFDPASNEALLRSVYEFKTPIEERRRLERIASPDDKEDDFLYAAENPYDILGFKADEIKKLTPEKIRARYWELTRDLENRIPDVDPEERRTIRYALEEIEAAKKALNIAEDLPPAGINQDSNDRQGPGSQNSIFYWLAKVQGYDEQTAGRRGLIGLVFVEIPILVAIAVFLGWWVTIPIVGMAWLSHIYLMRQYSRERENLSTGGLVWRSLLQLVIFIPYIILASQDQPSHSTWLPITPLLHRAKDYIETLIAKRWGHPPVANFDRLSERAADWTRSDKELSQAVRKLAALDLETVPDEELTNAIQRLNDVLDQLRPMANDSHRPVDDHIVLWAIVDRFSNSLATVLGYSEYPVIREATRSLAQQALRNMQRMLDTLQHLQGSVDDPSGSWSEQRLTNLLTAAAKTSIPSKSFLSGAMREPGRVDDPTNEGNLTQLKSRESEFEDIAVNLANQRKLKVDTIGQEHNFNSITAGIMKADLHSNTGAYQFFSERLQRHIIVLNESMPEDIQNEGLFHDSREIYWMVRAKFTQPEAHRIASAEQVMKFSKDGKLTPYHQLWMNRATNEQLDSIIREFDKGHYDTIDFISKLLVTLTPQDGLSVKTDVLNDYERHFYEQTKIQRMVNTIRKIVAPQSEESDSNRALQLYLRAAGATLKLLDHQRMEDELPEAGYRDPVTYAVAALLAQNTWADRRIKSDLLETVMALLSPELAKGGFTQDDDSRATLRRLDQKAFKRLDAMHDAGLIGEEPSVSGGSGRGDAPDITERAQQDIERIQNILATRFSRMSDKDPREYFLQNAMAKLLGYSWLGELINLSEGRTDGPELSISYLTTWQIMTEALKKMDISKTSIEAKDYMEAFAALLGYQGDTHRTALQNMMQPSTQDKLSRHQPMHDPFLAELGNVDVDPPTFKQRGYPAGARFKWPSLGPNETVSGPAWIVGQKGLVVKIEVFKGVIYLQRYHYSEDKKVITAIDEEPVNLARYLLDHPGQENSAVEQLGYAHILYVSATDIKPRLYGKTASEELTLWIRADNAKSDLLPVNDNFSIEQNGGALFGYQKGSPVPDSIPAFFDSSVFPEDSPTFAQVRTEIQEALHARQANKVAMRKQLREAFVIRSKELLGNGGLPIDESDADDLLNRNTQKTPEEIGRDEAENRVANLRQAQGIKREDWLKRGPAVLDRVAAQGELLWPLSDTQKADFVKSLEEGLKTGFSLDAWAIQYFNAVLKKQKEEIVRSRKNQSGSAWATNIAYTLNKAHWLETALPLAWEIMQLHASHMFSPLAALTPLILLLAMHIPQLLWDQKLIAEYPNAWERFRYIFNNDFLGLAVLTGMVGFVLPDLGTPTQILAAGLLTAYHKFMNWHARKNVLLGLAQNAAAGERAVRGATLNGQDLNDLAPAMAPIQSTRDSLTKESPINFAA